MVYIVSLEWSFQSEEVCHLANTKSAIKAIRVSEKRRQRNKATRSLMRSTIRKAQATLAGGQSDSSAQTVLQAIRVIDRSAGKGVIHPNQAARRKSRLMKKLKALQA